MGKPFVPALPLGSSTSTPPRPIAAVEGETVPASPQYLRLFGPIPPHMVMKVSPTSSSSEAVGQQGHGSPAALCDPTQPESHPLFALLDALGHPSARALASIAQLRARHLEKGHTPAADAARGPLFFKHTSDDA